MLSKDALVIDFLRISAIYLGNDPGLPAIEQLLAEVRVEMMGRTAARSPIRRRFEAAEADYPRYAKAAGGRR